MRMSLAVVFSVFAALAFSGCLFLDGTSGPEDVSMSVYFNSYGVEVVVHNDSPYPVWVQWADSSYVYQDGYSEWLAVLDAGGTDPTGTPYDVSVPAYSSVSTLVAPTSAVDPYTGEVWLPWGPVGSSFELVVNVRLDGVMAALDYVYRF